MDFMKFKVAVAGAFQNLVEKANGNIFRTGVSKDDLWDTYLNSFPVGTNLIYRERREHDCNCCKQFIRAVGDVVGIVEGKAMSIWDIHLSQPENQPYQIVANALSTLVKSYPIVSVFRHYEAHAGTNRNVEEKLGVTRTWEHFYFKIPKEYVMPASEMGTFYGQGTATAEVFQRSLCEITLDSVDVVLDLIAQNSLYRGEEHKFALTSFRELKVQCDRLGSTTDKHLFVWSHAHAIPQSVSRIRNTAIGTLLTDLSEGIDLEQAVKSFETKVAPVNYKRPTALISASMIAKAKEEVERLGLSSALLRRYARTTDISVNNVLYCDRSARNVMKDAGNNVFDDLAKTAVKPIVPNLSHVEEISIDKFISNILPMSSEVELLLENRFEKNLVSLVTSTDPTAYRLFKWDNSFSWSYNGNLTDSAIREAVKKAGGDVDGDLCCRLAWFNYDDLDFHMIEPDGYRICFRTRFSESPSGGRLDVDMNAGGGSTREAVENIFYKDKSRMKEGVYTLVVNNFCKRESIDVGFNVEIDMLGDTYQIHYPNAVRDREYVEVAAIEYSHARGFRIVRSLPSVPVSKNMWGLCTGQFHKVKLVTLSPNYWDDQPGVGNKHWFFMLDNCVNSSVARGFYNEFLRSELDQHRKVLEVLGGTLKLEDSPEQLSGVGFSSTQKNSVVVRVKGAVSRCLKVVF